MPASSRTESPVLRLISFWVSSLKRKVDPAIIATIPIEEKHSAQHTVMTQISTRPDTKREKCGALSPAGHMEFISGLRKILASEPEPTRALTTPSGA